MVLFWKKKIHNRSPHQSFVKFFVKKFESPTLLYKILYSLLGLGRTRFRL